MEDLDGAAPTDDGELLARVIRLLAEFPGQSIDELVEELERGGYHADRRGVRMLLIEHGDTFERRRGHWRIRIEARSPRPETAEQAPSTRNGATQPPAPRTPGMSQVDTWPGPGTVERNLRDQLAGRRLIAEIGLNALLLEDVRNALAQILERGTRPTEVVTHYPATLSAYLVGHGVYHYDGGEFWTTLELEGLDSGAWRQAFSQSLERLGVETFEDMVYGDNALRYVAPILAHGGIPRSSLDAYFGLIHRFLRQAGTAMEMLVLWRTRKAAFAGIGKPVRRFLLYGGDLSVDFIDRTIDMFREYARSGEVPKPAEIGLPPYVVLGFRAFVDQEHVSADSIAKRRAGVQPTVHLDPWGGSGVTLTLPLLEERSGHEPTSGHLAWRLQGDGQFERFDVSRFSAQEVQLRPARGWTVSLLDGMETRSEAGFEGLGEVPALFFDPLDGRLIGPSGGLRHEQVWVLLPKKSALEAVMPDGSQEPIRVVEELPEPSQAWSGFRQVSVDLRGLRAVAVGGAQQGTWSRVAVRSVAERPALVGAALAHARSVAGYSIYASAPGLTLPPGDWAVRVLMDGDPQPTRVVEAPDGCVLDLQVPGGVHEVELSAKGPLGSDFRARFVICPELTIFRPERVLMPGDSGGQVTLSSPALSIDDHARGAAVTVPVPEAGDQVHFKVAGSRGPECTVAVRVAKVLWALAGTAHESLEFANHPAVAAEDELTGVLPASLVVRTGSPDLPLRLTLTDGQAVLQESGRAVAMGEEGRWVFDLGRFSAAVRESDAAQLMFELVVGHVPTTAVRLRRSAHIWNVRATSRLVGRFGLVDLTFEEGRQLKERVARLWPVTRPWDDPIEQAVPDGQQGHVSIGGYEGLRPGVYLAEVTVDGGWTTPVRPAVGSPGSAVVQVGEPADIAGQFGEGPASDPFDRIEHAIVTGYFSGEFDDDDWSTAGAALADAAAQMAADQLPRYNTDTAGFRALRWFLCRSAKQLAQAIVECVEAGRIESTASLALAIELVGHLQRRPAAPTEPAISRALWAASPVLATALDLADPLDADRAARLQEFAGWDPLECTEPLTGEPVSQIYVGMSADQMGVVRANLDLIPGQILSLDGLVAAHLEWLLAEKRTPGTAEKWWYESRTLTHGRLELPHLASRHLAARRPPQGTEPWAAFPLLTLVAAFNVVLDLDRAPMAARMLQDAARFAPRLVTRDLVLAQILTAMSTRDVFQGALR